MDISHIANDHPAVRAIGDQLLQFKSATAAATAERDRVAFRSTQGDVAATQRLEELNVELLQYANGIERLTAARRGALEAAALEHAASRQELLAGHVKDALAALRNRDAAAAKLDKAVAAFGEALLAYQTHGTLAWDCLTHCSRFVGFESVLPLRDRALGSHAALAQALHDAVARTQEAGSNFVITFPGFTHGHDTITATARGESEAVASIVGQWRAA
jgi:hypothetical protein